ncbi:hypothetical protein IG631_15934 [Alternaria alternata]|nr:hypothetical protein IG631_15934 [Alternaria alternata]
MPRFKVHFPQGLHHSDGFCTLLHHDGMPRHRPSKVRWERGPVLASALERSAQHGVSDIDATAHHICVTATPSTHRFSSQGLLFRLPIWNISYLATVSVVHPPESSLAGLCTWVESPTTSGRALTCTLTRAATIGGLQTPPATASRSVWSNFGSHFAFTWITGLLLERDEMMMLIRSRAPAWAKDGQGELVLQVFGQIKRASSYKIGMLFTRPAQVNEFRATTSSQRGLPIDWHLTFTAACTSAPLHASCAGTLTAACVEALQQSSLVETAARCAILLNKRREKLRHADYNSYTSLKASQLARLPLDLSFDPALRTTAPKEWFIVLPGRLNANQALFTVVGPSRRFMTTARITWIACGVYTQNISCNFGREARPLPTMLTWTQPQIPHRDTLVTNRAKEGLV